MDIELVGRFNSRLEAEAIANALTQYDIPSLIRGDDFGIFGPGHSGATPQGVSLWVPADRLEEVRELMTCLFQSEPAQHDEPEDSE